MIPCAHPTHGRMSSAINTSHKTAAYNNCKWFCRMQRLTPLPEHLYKKGRQKCTHILYWITLDGILAHNSGPKITEKIACGLNLAAGTTAYRAAIKPYYDIDIVTAPDEHTRISKISATDCNKTATAQKKNSRATGAYVQQSIGAQGVYEFVHPMECVNTVPICVKRMGETLLSSF